MVDTGATHNFVMEQKAKDLGLTYVASNTMLKTVNALPTSVHGFAPKVPIDLGGWTGLTNFTIAPMDVFDIIFFGMRLTRLFHCVTTSCISATPEVHAWYPLFGYHKTGCTYRRCKLLRVLREVNQPFLLLLLEASKVF